MIFSLIIIVIIGLTISLISSYLAARAMKVKFKDSPSAWIGILMAISALVFKLILSMRIAL